MNVFDCPEWRYANHPRRAQLLTTCQQILNEIESEQVDSLEVASNTKSCHGRMFSGLTPAGHEYYAGHYRGEDYLCLRHAMVEFGGNLGAEPQYVVGMMENLVGTVSEFIEELDSQSEDPPPDASAENFLKSAVRIACTLFVRFLSIHPYRKGNGHAARLIVWAVLLRYGYPPLRFSVDPKPNNPNYDQLIQSYRLDDRSSLESYVIQCIG